jgi:hypothetical protein
MTNPVDNWMDELEEDFFEETWQGDSKRPLFKVNDDPLFLMTYGEPDAGEPRSWDHLRRSSLASPVGYENDGIHRSPPLLNWVSHYHTPESWEVLKDEVFPESDRYVVNLSAVARDNMRTRFKDYLEEDPQTVLMNPPEVIDSFRNKKRTSEVLGNAGIPTIPTADAETLVIDGEEELESELGPLEGRAVLKPLNGSGGDGVVSGTIDELRYLLDTPEGRTELLNEVEHPNPQEVSAEEVWQQMILQPEIEHNKDIRVETVGDQIVNGEIRYAPSDELCTNLSQVSSEAMGRDMGVYGKALNSMRGGRVVPLYMNFDGDMEPETYEELSVNREDIPSAPVRELTLDALEPYIEDSGKEVPLKHGADIIQTPVGSIEDFPNYEEILEYAENGTANLVMEQNGNPGSMVDLIARWSGNAEQISTLHVYNHMRELAGMESLDVEDVVENPESDVWSRLDGYYPSRDSDVSEYTDVATTNLKL